MAESKPSGGGRKAAAMRAATAAKASGDAAPVVAPLEYARVRHQQRRTAKKDAAPARRSSGGEGPGARGGGGRAGGAGGPRSGSRGGGGSRSGGRAPAPGSARGRLPRPRRAVAWVWSGNRRLLTAEFVLCVAILAAAWVIGRTDAAAAQAAAKSAGTGKTEQLTSSEAAVRVMVKGSALAAVFFLLALVASAGKGPARTATALGTLITAAYALTSPDVHTVASWAAQFYTKPGHGKAR